MSALKFNFGQQKKPQLGLHVNSERIHHPVAEYILAKTARQPEMYENRP